MAASRRAKPPVMRRTSSTGLPTWTKAAKRGPAGPAPLASMWAIIERPARRTSHLLRRPGPRGPSTRRTRPHPAPGSTQFGSYRPSSHDARVVSSRGPASVDPALLEDRGDLAEEVPLVEALGCAEPPGL